MKRIISLILTAFMLLTCFSTAYSAIAQSELSLTIKCLKENNPVSYVEFSVYKVGENDQNFNIVIDSRLKEYCADAEKITPDNYQQYTDSILSGVYLCGMQPVEKGQTNENGGLKFKLNEGLYLAVGKAADCDEGRYKPQPVLVLLPCKINSEIVYNVIAETKYQIVPFSKKTDLKAVKIWENDNGIHPESVTVELFKDGVLFEERVLNSANNWSYQWKDLDAGYNWTVGEKNIPSNYKASVEFADEKTVKITNKYIPGQARNSSDVSNITQTEKLPQTGVLWWPVFVLAVVGLLLIIIGFALRNKKRK